MEIKSHGKYQEEIFPDEVFVEVTQEDLCAEISLNTKVPVDSIKTIIATFIKHQLETMKL